MLQCIEALVTSQTCGEQPHTRLPWLMRHRASIRLMERAAVQYKGAAGSTRVREALMTVSGIIWPERSLNAVISWVASLECARAEEETL